MRLLLAGGGSGGSATPLLAVAEELRARHPELEIIFLGTRTGPERGLAVAHAVPYMGISAGRLRRYWSLENVLDVFRIAHGIGQSFAHVRRFRPTVAFGAGGFASVPPLIAASLLGVPVAIHQQDVVPGLANRLLVPFARSISVSFSASLAHFPPGRTRLRGNPVRPQITAADLSGAYTGLWLETGLPLVLVTGGGTGALELNRLVVAAARSLTRSAQVLHLTGRGRGVPAPDLGPRYQQREFLVDEMPLALVAADVVVSRAGLATISELAALRKPAILIPMPDSHQEANARLLDGRRAAIVFDERRLTAELLAETVTSLIDDSARRLALGTAIGEIMPRDATVQLADDLEALSDARPR